MRKLLDCRTTAIDFSCVLVHYPYTDPYSDNEKIDLSLFSDAEKDLMDHCDSNWGYSQMPVIKLPEKWKQPEEFPLRKKKKIVKKPPLGLVILPSAIVHGFGVNAI